MAKDLEQLPKLRIRGQIAPKNSLFELLGGGETFGASDVVKFLDEHKEDPEIVVEISSDGGYKTEGVEIRRLLKNSDKVVHTVGYKVNSIASVIFLGNANGGKRLVVEDPMDFVIHTARIDPMNLGTDSLTAEDFQKLAAEVQRSDKEILDIYCEELGEDKRGQLLAYMGEETNLGAKGAIKLGFADGYYKKKKKEKAEAQNFKGVLIDDYLGSIIQNNMEKTLTEKVNGFEKILNNLVQMFKKGKVKNEVTVTTDKGQIYLDTAELEDPATLVGAKAYAVGEDGLPLLDTPAADGEYTNTETGEVIVVAGGVVTEVNAAVDAKKLTEELNAEKEKTKALETKLAEMETQIQAKVALEAKVKELEAKEAKMQIEVDKIQNEFNKFKKTVPGDKREKEEDEEGKPKKDFSKMSVAQRLHEMRKEAKFK